MLKAGVTFDHGENYALNVIPTKAEAGFDIRLSCDIPVEELEVMVQKWTADEQLSYEWVAKAPRHGISSIKEEDPWWSGLKNAFKEIETPLDPQIFPAATDSRYLRYAGIHAYGFSPMRNTPVLLHDHNEFLNKNIYLEGIDVYTKIIPHLANLLQHKLDFCDDAEN